MRQSSRKLRPFVVRPLVGRCLVALLGAASIAASATEPSASSALAALADAWFDAQLEHSPFLATSVGDRRYDTRFDFSIQAEVRQRFADEARRLQREVRQLQLERGAALGEEDRITLEVLIWDLDTTLDLLEFPEHLLPLDSMESSVPFALARMASPFGDQPFETVADYDAYLARLQAFDEWVEIAKANARQGIELGVVHAKVIVQTTIQRLDALLSGFPNRTPFHQPLRRFPESIDRTERKRLARAYNRSIDGELQRAYLDLRQFWQAVVLPQARSSISWKDLPDGERWYLAKVRRSTSTDLTPDEILTLGTSESARLLGELAALAARLEHKDVATMVRKIDGARDSRLRTRDEVLGRFQLLEATVQERLGPLFPIQPTAPLRIHMVEPTERAFLSGNQYLPGSADGKRPGTFLVAPTLPYPTWRMESLFLHEALPGHHFQIALAQELEELPRMRRHFFSTAYIEGWGLYAESLGADLGLYSDPHQQVGRLSMELLRAARLILDSGIHQGGWGFGEARRAAQQQTLGAGEDELFRYASIPAQALAYKVGEQRILQLRREAEEALGPAFELGDFHREILRHGALPLAVLERQVRRWIDERLREGAG